MAKTGKTGADAILKAIDRICKVIAKYSAKLDAVTTQAQSAGVLTAAQAATVRELISAATAYCIAFDLLAGYSGFDTNP